MEILRACVAVGVAAGLLTMSGGCGRTEPVPSAPAGSPKLSEFDAQANELLARMTLEEKIAQMTQPDQQYLQDLSEVSRYGFGSLLSGGDSDPKEGNEFAAWRDMYAKYQAEALKSRLRIPLLYGVDGVHGHSNVIGAVIFPHNVGLGCTRNPELVEAIGKITAKEIRATGIHWTFAPCVTVPRDDRWGRTYEGFGEDPALVAELGEAATRGLQGKSLGDPVSVLACAKHYLADGGTIWGSGTVAKGDGGFYPIDRGDNRMEEVDLRRIHLPGYLSSLNAGVASIMPSYSSWKGLKMSGHKYLLTDVLKNELGFDGFLISDYNAIEELAGTYKEQIEQSVNAGMDMMMVPSRYREYMTLLKELVDEGQVPLQRIDDAVRRILRVKFAMGLFEHNGAVDPALAADFGSEAHRSIARDAVRQSLVLLKNSEGLLPLAKNLPRIVVAGRGADNLGMQCGGWTIKWQGEMGPVTKGTTILEALRGTVDAGTRIDHLPDGNGASGNGVALVVIGEKPYAEFTGDSADIALEAEDVQTVLRVKQAGLRTVVVVLSGRPVILGPVLDQADAVVAAWLPGTEGAGVTDVLFGDYKPIGKLSYTWPKSVEQEPINVGDPEYDPLFPYGFGLTW